MCLGAALLAGACGGQPPASEPEPPAQPLRSVVLPAPATSSAISVEQALATRRSVREFDGAPLTLGQAGQLLWAAQGITEEGGRGRTAPSAGGTYPLELYVATGEGLSHYLPDSHALDLLVEGDLRPALAAAALGQEWVGAAPAVFAVVGVVGRTAARYGDRAGRYVDLEAGHAAQNLLLQAVALSLGAVPVGAFDDAAVRGVLGIPGDWTPLYLIPVGHPAAG